MTAGRFDVVAQLAKELGARRIARAGNHLRDPRDGRACIRLVQQATKETSDEPMHLADPKRGSKRTNPMHSQLATWLTWWRQTGWERYAGRAPTEEDFLFPDRSGNMYRPRDADMLRKWATKAGIPTTFVRQDGTEAAFTLNALRRTFASLLGDLEVDGELLDDLLGHKAKSVRARHYQGTWFHRKVHAVERLQLKLPKRDGVAAPPNSVPESSQGSGGQLTGTDDSLVVAPLEVRGVLVQSPVFKTGAGRESVLGGFDSRALPPISGEEYLSLA